jgi:hypothetical protein
MPVSSKKLIRSPADDEREGCCGAGGEPALPTPRAWQAHVAMQVLQVGFGGYGIVVKRFAQNSDVNQLIFSFYRCAGRRGP